MKPKIFIQYLCLLAGSTLAFQNASAGVYLIYNGVHTPVDACRHSIGDGSNPEIQVNGEWVDSGVQGICDSYSAAPNTGNTDQLHNRLRSGQVVEKPIIRHTAPVVRRPNGIASPVKPREPNCEGHRTDYTYDCERTMARTAHDDLISEDRGWKEYIYVYNDTTFIRWEPGAYNPDNTNTTNGSNWHRKKKSDAVVHYTSFSKTRSTGSIQAQGLSGHQIGDSRKVNGHITTTSVFDIPLKPTPLNTTLEPVAPRKPVPMKTQPNQPKK